MDDVYDICIIGAGMIGSAAAWHITKLTKMKVVLIGPNEPEERSTTTVFGSHYDEGRITQVVQDNPILAELAKCSINRYSEIERISGVHFYDKTGFLFAGEASGKEIIKRMCDTAKHVGVEYTPMNYIEARTAFPYFKFQEDIEMVYDPMGGNISPRRQVSAHKEASRQGGCHVVDDIVMDVTQSTCTITVLTESGKTFMARKVLVATGAFTQFRNLLPRDKTLDVQLKAQTILKFEIDDEEARRLQDMPGLSILQDRTETPTFSNKHNLKCYILPPVKYPNGKWYLKLGHGVEGEFMVENEKDVVKCYRGKGNPRAAENLLGYMLSLIPDLRYLSLETDCCLTTQTKSGYIYIDMVADNIGIAVGGNGGGAKMSDEVGHIAARMIMKGGWDYDMPAHLFKASYKSPI